MMVFICAWVPALLGCVPLAVRFRSMKARARWALLSVTVASLLLGALALYALTSSSSVNQPYRCKNSSLRSSVS